MEGDQLPCFPDGGVFCPALPSSENTERLRRSTWLTCSGPRLSVTHTGPRPQERLLSTLRPRDISCWMPEFLPICFGLRKRLLESSQSLWVLLCFAMPLIRCLWLALGHWQLPPL